MFTILASGNWTPRQVRVAWADDSRPRIAEIEQIIDATWQQAMARPGVRLFDGKMCRLESWKASADALDLVLSPTSYKIFVGTNLTHPELADRHGREALANPVGLSAALLTADGCLMLGRRNAAVAYYPSRIHPFAGCLEPADSGDVFAAVQRELAEELDFTSVDIAAIRCIGIIEDNAIRQPEVIFRVQTFLTRAEVEQRVDAAEHVASYAVAATPAGVAEALQNAELTPVGRGSLVLWGGAIAESGGDE